ncbi:DEAD/DEAH box helicase family protein [Thermosipho ferrireducens]|uniref:DEAD/DEAH box helicase family protein n=1 Tax=Thermosipho ferrireducens TaxID=2571116 RepID=A0ABX7S721_9BACT|nr:DEAD/DEAH box helicase family protein [Thermosipho ferrireducens]QTA37580.1 DEAD/DEAH box helicase family protein [Thermosipho ferrireducens]
MPTPINTGTRDVPLKFARVLTEKVNYEWENGDFLAKVSPVTQNLLTYWFTEPFTDNRNFNFHEGQKQAILNTIYLHEVLEVSSVIEMYERISPELIHEMDITLLMKEKYNIPKYAIKMATGTGKTWVMHALLIWQYLNAKFEIKKTERYSKNFLLVAPGLIVYNRLLDAYLGKENESGERVFETSDIYRFRELFIPPSYRDIILGFVQSSVVKKEEIGSKVTGDGLIAITNWHLLMEKEENEEKGYTPLEDVRNIANELLPISPGTTAGHSLEALDNNYFRGKEIDFLARLSNLVVINDEAHHIHENKSYGEIMEVEWQKSLNRIAENKGKNFIQIDFSATPYDVTGSGRNRTKHYFPHIVVDFDLKTAIWKGLVKTIVIDKRKEIATLPLDFKAIRDGKEVIELSEGQRLMIRAGLQKLKILEEQFTKIRPDKHPKMLIICEDTKVAPLVVNFLKKEGLSENDILQIDSNKKGEVPQKEWDKIKQKLFNIDKYEKPKIIVSVLMLREGFDVNNICVIVPLRSSEAPILLEQIVGRGLRLMWREKDFEEAKLENRRRLLVEKKEPINYLDILSIIEHPKFMEFYNELMREGIVAEVKNSPKNRGHVLGDIIKVGLKNNYQKYELFWPIIIQEQEEVLRFEKLSINDLQPFKLFPLEKLKQYVPEDGEVFYSEELTVKTRFGDYKVSKNIFNANGYNELLARIVDTVTNAICRIGKRKIKEFPLMQINQVELAKIIDKYIRYKLFSQEFDPLKDNNWRILLLHNNGVLEHILREISKVIFSMQKNVDVIEAIVEKRNFSEVKELTMRENFSLKLTKTIYERLSYPSNKGGFEKEFMLFIDRDSSVETFIKIYEHKHTFAHILYIRNNGILSLYFPDFLVKTKKNMYVVETKADKDITVPNVKQKQLAALEWVKKINKLRPELRMECKWKYVLLGENTFYGLKDNGASAEEILEYAANYTDKQLTNKNLFEF